MLHKKPKIVFAPGCFDNFEGTQEELDKMVAEIYELVENGKLFEETENLGEMDEEELEEFLEDAEISIRSIHPPERTLQ